MIFLINNQYHVHIYTINKFLNREKSELRAADMEKFCKQEVSNVK